MGLFGSKKTYVSSTVYNLAGDETKRPNYLKTLVINNIISRGRFSMPETLRKGYEKGPNARMRSFFHWAKEHYGLIGVPSGNLGGTMDFDNDILAAEIPREPGESVLIQDVELAGPDYAYWAEQYMLANHPDLLGTDWTSDIDEASKTVIIQLADQTLIEVPVPDYEPKATYLYVVYNLAVERNQWGPTRIWIYRVGSGNLALDTMVRDEVAEGEYFPFIPVRINNKFLSQNYEPEAYELCKDAYKRATGGDLDELIAQIADNESLPDIDYTYVFFGVSLNAKSREAKEYLFRFWDKLRLSQTSSNIEYRLYEQAQANFESNREGYYSWLGGDRSTTAPWTQKTGPNKPTSSVRIKSSGSLDTDLDMTLSWKNITLTEGTGLKKPDAQVGEYWLTKEPLAAGAPKKIYVEGAIFFGDKTDNSVFAIHHQVTADRWRTLTIHGAVHRNEIYNNKSVYIDAWEALDDADESGFLVPLHYATLREMSLPKATQLQINSAYLVFNSYKVVKKKWYQTGIFKIVMIIVIVAITIISPPAGGVSAGILGSSAAVGAAIGLSGLTALIVGAAINAIAGMIVAQLIMTGATLVFGDKLGAIIGAIAAFAALQIGTALSNGMELSTMWQNLMSADNLIRMSSAVGNGVGGYIQASALDVVQKTNTMLEGYAEDMERMSELYAQNIGYDRGVIDPLSLTDVKFGNALESQDQFLTRTLLTGSDIAEMSIDMLSRFSDYTLSTRLPGLE